MFLLVRSKLNFKYSPSDMIRIWIEHTPTHSQIYRLHLNQHRPTHQQQSFYLDNFPNYRAYDGASTQIACNTPCWTVSPPFGFAVYFLFYFCIYEMQRSARSYSMQFYNTRWIFRQDSGGICYERCWGLSFDEDCFSLKAYVNNIIGFACILVDMTYKIG